MMSLWLGRGEAGRGVYYHRSREWLEKKVRDPVAEFCMQSYGLFILS